ncbi:hypothetical protein [Haloplanus aerogenes]|uniref:Uncharacterized protein n=1 Tax=Haloplanus aerogenes TaxID=660522 RepID=A0A3M0CWU6_9EURY|nr:hypothetical protein [Haloplanus aerogenes]AZH25106.1 hypothetical protein DU502_06830 [Haloplanus aerogenes]RMB13671.1 hypothetical protein ATH50_2110 [Haloplanus aerogenes]
MTDPIEWDDDAGPRLDAARHVAVGAVVGAGFLLAAGVLRFIWRAFRAGAYDRLFAVVVALAVALFTGRALLGIAVTDTPTDDSLRRRPLLVAGGAWAIVLAVVVRWRPLVAVALLAGAGVLWFVVGVCLTCGRIDPAAGTLTYGLRTTSLDGLIRVRRVPFGPVTAYWLGFAHGSVGSGAPRTLVVPRRVDGAVRAALDRAAASEDETASEGAHHTPGRIERAVAASLGLGCLLAGPVAWVLLPADGDATLVAGYLTLLGAPFGILLLRYALVA